MGKLTKEQLQVRNREIQDRMAEMNDKAFSEKREFTADEKREWEALTREAQANDRELRNLLNDAELAQVRQNADRNAQLRELLKNNGQKREILLAPASSNDTANVTASGAINLSIHDLIPSMNEGLGLPSTLRIVTGVTGNEIWPVGIDDVEMEEVGEVEALSDQKLNFANITPAQKRVGLKVPVSNMAIDNAAFDIMGYVSNKFKLALAKYLAKKTYSQAAWNGNKGPFSGLTATGTIDLTGGKAYKKILKAVADFTNKGFDASGVVLVFDAVTEAELKATPKASGQGGFIIENGKCAGYNYVISHYINTTLDGNNKLVETSDRFIGIGYFQWLAVQQHGEVRFVIDPITLADKNVTRLILNTAWSMTDLSTRINGGTKVNGEYVTQAFALYSVVLEEESES